MNNKFSLQRFYIDTKIIKKFFLYSFLAFLIASSIVTFDIAYPHVMQSFDGKIRDYMFFVRGKIPPKNNVIIVDIDEKSLSKLGQWPWSRNKLGQILQNLSQNGASAIGFDIVFAEEDQSSPKKVFTELQLDATNVADYDADFNTIIANTPTILGYQFELQEQDFTRHDSIDIPAIFIEKNKLEGEDKLINAKGTILNHKSLQESGYSSGFFNNIPDDGGIVRSVPLIIRYDDQIYPSISLEIVRASLGIEKVFINYSELGVENIQLGDFIIPTDKYGRLVVNYKGGAKTFKYISAYDIYSNNFKSEDIKDKIILIGTSAAGLLDLRATPFESVSPGVEVHATAIDNIINSEFLAIPNWVDGANLVIIFCLALFVVWLTTFTPFWFNPFALIFTMSIFLGINYYILFYKGIILDAFVPMVTIGVSSLVATFMDYIFEVRKEKMMKKKFASKVSSEVMEQLLKNSESDLFVAMEKEATIMFSDVRNFTNISESMPNAKVLIDFLNAYMTPMTEIIIKRKGTVDKFIGDAIMAYWNAPGDVEDHPTQAVVATLEQLHAIDDLNAKIKKDKRFANTIAMCDKMGVEPIAIGIGLNTGMVVAGEMGSNQRSDYTVIGDPVNLAARLESLCKYYDSRCNITHFTKGYLTQKFIYRFLDLVTVKGKKEPIEIWQIVDFDRDESFHKLYNVSRKELDEELDLYHHAIELYKKSFFQEALAIFETLQVKEQKTNKAIYKIYIERCEHYITEPPIDFDGVFKHTTKG
jgi:adenylate cyclase